MPRVDNNNQTGSSYARDLTDSGRSETGFHRYSYSEMNSSTSTEMKRALYLSSTSKLKNTTTSLSGFFSKWF